MDILWITVHYHNYIIFILLLKGSHPGPWELSEVGSFVLLSCSHHFVSTSSLSPQSVPGLYYVCCEKLDEWFSAAQKQENRLFFLLVSLTIAGSDTLFLFLKILFFLILQNISFAREQWRSARCMSNAWHGKLVFKESTLRTSWRVIPTSQKIFFSLAEKPLF